MADDLVFPGDDVSELIGDFGILDDDVINPAFPQSDLLNIPPIVPSLISGGGVQRNYAQQAMHNMNVNSPTVNSSYRPINQLMKQTQELASTLGSPLSSSLNQQQLNYNNMINSTSLINQHHHALSNNILQQNPLVGNNLSYTNTPKPSQFVVVGGQRVSMQQHASPQHLQSTGSPLHSQGPQLVDIGSSSSGLQSSMNSIKPMQQIINANNQQKQGLLLKLPQHQQSQQITQSLISQQKTVPTPQPQLQQQIIQPENLPTTQKSAPLKGSIIKTSNQQLMFVTEVNGKKVGYVIQHPKPNTSTPSLNPDNINVTVTTMSHPQSVQVTSSQRSPVQTVPSIDSIKPTIQQKEKEPKQTDIKSLRERLQGLRNNNVNIKQQVNLKSQLPAMEKSDKVPPPPNSHYIESRIIQVNPASAHSPGNTASKIISDFDMLSDDNKQTFESSMNHHQDSVDFMEEEEGQEIEFSENDLTTAEQQVDSDEPIITSISVRQVNEIEDLTETVVNEDDDSDSLPLSLLRNDGLDLPISIVCEKEGDEVDIKPSKRSKKSQSDSVPLSVVAASLKKDQDDGKPPKKKRGRKKKKKDENEPVK